MSRIKKIIAAIVAAILLAVGAYVYAGMPAISLNSPVSFPVDI